MLLLFYEWVNIYDKSIEKQCWSEIKIVQYLNFKNTLKFYLKEVYDNGDNKIYTLKHNLSFNVSKGINKINISLKINFPVLLQKYLNIFLMGVFF